MSEFDLASQLRVMLDDDSSPPIDVGGPTLGDGTGTDGNLGGTLWPKNLFAPKSLKELFDEERRNQLREALLQLRAPVSVRTTMGVIEPPRNAIDRCLRLVRKLASLREEHRTLISAQLAHRDMLEDLEMEREFRALPVFANHLKYKQDLASKAVDSQDKIATLADEIYTRIDHQLRALYTDDRITVLARAEADIVNTQQLASPPGTAAEPPETSIVMDEAVDGAITWSPDERLKTGTTFADRVRTLSEAMSRITQLKERMGARIGLSDAAIRNLYLEIEALKITVDKTSAEIEVESTKHENKQIETSIYRLNARDGMFFNNFGNRIAHTIVRYVETAQKLSNASRRLVDSLKFHGLGAIQPFDPTVLIDATNSTDDDAAIQSYLDLVEEMERRWNQQIAGAIGGLLPAGTIFLERDKENPELLSAVLVWQAPLKTCYVEGVLIEASQREVVNFAVEISSLREEFNKVGVVLDQSISREFYSFPVETCLADNPTRESTIVRGGFLASLIDETKLRITVPAKGRKELELRLYVEAFGKPMISA
jgi:hypothetical protein